MVLNLHRNHKAYVLWIDNKRFRDRVCAGYNPGHKQMHISTLLICTFPNSSHIKEFGNVHSLTTRV